MTRYRPLGPDTWVVVCDTDDDIVAALRQVAAQEGLRSSRLQGIGGLRAATVGYFDTDRNQYQPIHVEEQTEILSLLGDITDDGAGAPQVHAHVVLGRRDGTTVGGHLLAGTVRPTGELLLTEAPRELRRRHDPATGLALIDHGDADWQPIEDSA